MSDQSEELSRRISEFISITGASAGSAQKYLESSDFNLEGALQQYFEESVDQAGNSTSTPQEVPRPSSSSSSTSIPKNTTKSTQKKKKFRTFQDIVNGTNDDTSDDDDTNFFTGGEKSALQVENPNKNNPANLVQDILKKATDPNNGARPDDNGPVSKRNQFSGTGFKLGDTQTPSTAIPDRSANFKKPERVERKITFWRDGFSVGEGALYRYDDPRNASYLRDLNSGRAPLELLDVKLGQDVDVNVDKRLDEDYTPPKRKIGGFSGSGFRLGSPVPGDIAPAAVESTSETVQNVEEPKKEEESIGEGDARLQIRLADGTRIIHKFNSSDPVQTVYDFVSSHTSSSREFFLSLSFPVKPLEDKSISIKDAGLVNAAVIQRWL